MSGHNKYAALTVEQLKDELRPRGARLSGRKNDLIERLLAYDRNNNFAQGDDVVVDHKDFKMSVPAYTCYRDINTGALATVNRLTKETAAAYLDMVDTTFEDGQKLYDSRWLQFLRWSQDEDMTFYLGQCWAEMKKSASYIVNVSINGNGEILQTECECAAGEGPAAYCKHTQAVLLAVIDFTGEKQPKLEVSCTEKLQTFHRPKKLHTGSPVMAKNLKLFTENVPLQFDPRPMKYRNMASYPDHVKNLTVNFVATSGGKIPLMQTVRPANMYAVEHDHMYLAKPGSLLFLEQQNISVIDPKVADSIEESTESQALSREWKEQRKNRIQSSNFGRVMSTVSTLAKENLAKEMVLGKDFKSKYTAHGKAREPHAIKASEDQYRVTVTKSGIVLSMEKPYLGASPDGLVGEDIVLEVKCPYVARNEFINVDTVDYLLEDDGVKLNPKHAYYAQVQGQMWVTERPMCHFVVHTFKETKVFEVPRDSTYIKLMVEKLDKFYQDIWCPLYLKRHFYNEL